MTGASAWPGMEELRRARLRWIRMCDGLSRAYLPCGGFVDRAELIGHRSYGYRYGLWRPAMPCAQFIAGANTVRGLRERLKPCRP